MKRTETKINCGFSASLPLLKASECEALKQGGSGSFAGGGAAEAH
jgi:hypothetical protein